MRTKRKNAAEADRSLTPCPACGAPVAAHRFEAGNAAFWCRRCSWSLIEGADGEVERETTPDVDSMEWPPISSALYLAS